MILTVIFGALILFLLWECLRPDKPPEENKPGRFYYIKKWLFYLMFVFNSRRKQTDVQTDRTKRGYGQTLTDLSLLDCCQALEDSPDAIDTTYFNGFGADGTSLALRIARKHGREGELWALLEIPGVGYFQHPLHPDSAVFNMPEDEFCAAGCKFQVVERMRRWKIKYNGLMRKGLYNDLDNKPEEFSYVKMSLNWECVNDPFNFDTDLDVSQLADGIAKQKWTKAFWEKLRNKHQTHYEQCGELSGTIEVEGHPVKRVHLKSFRDHTFGVRNWEMFHRYAAHFIWVEETGMMIFMIVLWMPGYITFLKTGYLVYANGDTYPVTDTDLDLVDITKEKTPPSNYNFTLKAGGDKYDITVQIHTIPELYHYSTRTSRILETLCTFTVNERSARGLVEFHYRNPEGPTMREPLSTSVPLLTEPQLLSKAHSGEVTLTFQDKACQSSLLVGGKGAQLALLTSIQDKLGAKVPQGFCLTLEAFQTQQREQKNCMIIGDKLDQLTEALRENDAAREKACCDDVVHQINSSPIIPPITDEITTALRSIFGDVDKDNISLAVRSSAAGEDGSEASSAGQMETFLGVRGTGQVIEAIQKCWASAFTYQAVEYRRQHGQSVHTSVGVVIQEMVPSDISGVLFTHDPLTGNPNKMVLDASYGLGEIVVSGKATPDTVVICRHFDGQLKIVEKNLGEKKTRINMLEGGGTIEIDTDKTLTQKCCLSDEQILQLCKMAIQVENYFGGGRDIEWSIHGNQIYLLQARPITTDDLETEEELLHEFDSPILTGKEWLTIGNIGEMMPGCVTPLTASTFIPAVDGATVKATLNLSGGHISKYPRNKSVMLHTGRAFINLTYLSQQTNQSMIGQKDALELNLIGETLPDHKLDDIVQYGKLKTSRIQKIVDLLRFFSLNKKDVKIADSWTDKVKTYNIGQNCTTASELYAEIDSRLPEYYEMWQSSVIKSGEAGHANAFMLGVISGGKNKLTLDNYRDVSQLLAQCQNVYSAEVPAAIQEIAKTIENCGVTDMFLEKSDSECVEYLTSSACDSQLQKQYTQFLERHGHRCVREAEFTERSWRAEPEKFIKILKSVLTSKAYNLTPPAPPDTNEIIQNLSSPVSAIGRFMLKRIVPKAREGVKQRELSKSVAVQVSDKFKEAYWTLAEWMVCESRLPDQELMFYLTHTEIGHLLTTRSSKLIAKAIRRRKLLPAQSALEYPRFCIGRPQPIKEDVEDGHHEVQASFTANGTPVCRGSIRGTARVVKSLDEASSIQKGDIMIVSYTDIGWTPYFPLISGLVTEMGGLVSHGAVVAREYGLPCLVNVSKATKLFTSGDQVHLDANNGAIHKLDLDTPETE